MGHDITAYRPGVNRDALRKELNLDKHDEGWLKRYEEYDNRSTIAYNRRSAGNPLNQVLYLALGVMDEAYAGCSGSGVNIYISKEQFETGLEALEVKDFFGMTQERNFADDIVEGLRQAGMKVIQGGTESSDDISQELSFIQKCIEHLNISGADGLDVSFS